MTLEGKLSRAVEYEIYLIGVYFRPYSSYRPS